MMSIKIKYSGICTHIHTESYRECGLWCGPNQESPLHGEIYTGGNAVRWRKRGRCLQRGAE